MSTFAEFEAAITKAWDEGKAAGAAAIAIDKTGTKHYAKAFGKVSREPGAKPVALDTTAWIASCTKLLTAVSALQCVQNGLFTLDENVGRLLPQLASPQILTSISDDGKPQIKTATKPITLRRLLTHSSGLGYSAMNPLLIQYWHEVLKKPQDSSDRAETLEERFATMLTFEPGEGWDYSTGLDWAGKMVEQATGKTLGEYFEENIFKPLGMTLITFKPRSRPDVLERLLYRPLRKEDGSLEPMTLEGGMYPVIDVKDDFGGSGLYGCAQDYIKVLQSLLHDDGKLLKSEWREELFRPQLEPAAKEALNQVIKGPFGTALLPGMQIEGTTVEYALGGNAVVSGISGHVGKGTMYWSGLPNSYWFIDREGGVAGIYVTQLFPFGDPVTQSLSGLFQKSVYNEFGST